MDSFWALPEGQVLDTLKANKEKGLSAAEAKGRLGKNGYNLITQKDATPAWAVLWRQFQSPLIIILIVAALISVAQRDLTDALVIMIVVVVNTAVGFFQEYRAERTIENLRKALPETARVIRDGIEQKIAARNLVVGDIIIVEAGDKTPADARIIQTQNLRVNEAALTGEAVPAHKDGKTAAKDAPLAERDNMLFMSTFVVDGRALAVVTGTGMNTEIGRISAEVTRLKSVPTVLQRKITVFGRYVLIAAVSFSLLIFLFGVSQNIEPDVMLKTALSLLVSVVPEGLPIAVTVVLSVGLLRMYRRHALIRKLSAAETLGGATVICVDKTGTLTEGKMMVEKLIVGGEQVAVSGHGYSLSGDFLLKDKKIAVSSLPPLKVLLELGSLATMSTISRDDLENDEAKLLTDPTETALAVVASKAGFYAFREEKRHPEILEIPFDQELRYSTSVHRFGNHNRYITKGAPEKVLRLSTHVLSSTGVRQRLLTETRAKLSQAAEESAGQGFRLVALAYCDRPSSEELNAKHARSLTFVGYFCISDPIRADVRQAVAKAKDAGVRVVMLTGDHLLTAETIAQKVGLDAHGEVIHAADLAHHSLKNIGVVARATPGDKLRIVERLQRRGEIVAMTGDGVNDAPALKRADIGIAMGKSGTAVAVEAAEMVLLRDNFSSIVEAIQQGRLIWENLRKVVFYLISTTLAEVLVIVSSLVIGLPLPLLAVQILWMNLVTNGVTSMALTVEPEEANLMKRPPVRHSALVDWKMLRRMLPLSGIMLIGSLLIFVLSLDRGLDYARSATLTAMVFFQLINIFNARSETQSVFQMKLFSNRLLLICFGLAALLQLAALYTPAINRLIGTVPLDPVTVLAVIAISASIILVDELRKGMRRVALQWAKMQQVFVER
jgi:P-type Ca2+ transporter type 2C